MFVVDISVYESDEDALITGDAPADARLCPNIAQKSKFHKPESITSVKSSACGNILYCKLVPPIGFNFVILDGSNCIILIISSSETSKLLAKLSNAPLAYCHNGYDTYNFGFVIV